jgi:hypothetical protein
MFGFTTEEFFEVEDEADREDVDVDFSTIVRPAPPVAPPATLEASQTPPGGATTSPPENP